MRAFLLSILLLITVPAFALYKCEAGGKTSYSQTPCPGGVQLDDQASAAPSASALAEAKRKAAADKKEADRLTKARHAAEAKEARERERIARAAEAKRKKCAGLALRKKWAEQDAESASLRTEARAKRKALRASEKYQAECAA